MYKEILEENPVTESTSVGQAENTSILTAYFSVPEDVDTDGADAVSGASSVVDDGEILGNLQYAAEV